MHDSYSLIELTLISTQYRCVSSLDSRHVHSSVRKKLKASKVRKADDVLPLEGYMWMLSVRYKQSLTGSDVKDFH